MDFFSDLAYDVLAGLLYGVVGLGLMMAGYLVIDMLTPGRLGDLICVKRRRDIGIVVASSMLANAAIVTSAILASDGDLEEGLAETAGFGLAGLILLAIAFVARSEEHTSELQSRQYLVCRLLLEKKKNSNT